jgi:hypothetical protein
VAADAADEGGTSKGEVDEDEDEAVGEVDEDDDVEDVDVDGSSEVVGASGASATRQEAAGTSMQHSRCSSANSCSMSDEEAAADTALATWNTEAISAGQRCSRAPSTLDTECGR